MAVLPSFTPAQPPDTEEKIVRQAQGDTQSWMDQAAQRQQISANTDATQQQTAQRQQQFQALMPALLAKRDADVATAKNSVVSSVIQQNFDRDAANQLPQATQEFTDALKIPDFEAKATAMEGLQAKYGWLGQSNSGKSLATAIDNARMNAHQEAVTNLQLKGQMAIWGNKTQQTFTNQEQLVKDRAAWDAAMKPVIAQTEDLNKQRTQTFNDIASQRDALGKMSYAISTLGQDIGKEQSSSLGSGPVVGSAIAGMVRPSVRQVQQDIGDFATNIMSTVKNIRNINEFRAVTASIPHPDDQPEVQNEKLQKLQAVSMVLTQRNDYMEKALRADPKLSRDEADLMATQKYPFPSSVMADSIAKSPPAAMSSADAAALKFAQENPTDPRSAAIIQHLSTLK